MSGYDSASTSDLLQRLADTEETLTALRSSQAKEQERYDRAVPGSKEYLDADSNLWWYQSQI